MKIIDLLNKIANGEEVPKKIKWRNEIYKYNGRWEDYKKEADEVYFFQTMLNRNCDMLLILNDKVEIIEKEIEFEDIKELGNNFTFENTNSELETRDFEKSIISKKINSLIKNQKKIIYVINDMRDKEC